MKMMKRNGASEQWRWDWEISGSLQSWMRGYSGLFIGVGNGGPRPSIQCHVAMPGWPILFLFVLFLFFTFSIKIKLILASYYYFLLHSFLIYHIFLIQTTNCFSCLCVCVFFKEGILVVFVVTFVFLYHKFSNLYVHKKLILITYILPFLPTTDQKGKDFSLFGIGKSWSG